MDRRAFLRRMAALGAAGGAMLVTRGPLGLLAQEGPSARTPGATYPNVAAVMGGEPELMFDRGIAALGGMRRFVARGQTVAIKPNMSWGGPPEAGATTNPKLVKRIIEHCFEAGASKVWIFDNSIESWKSTMASSMIEPYARQAGAQFVPGNSKGYYQEITIPRGRSLKMALVHEAYLGANVVINVPILKHHGSTGITAAMKNLMGVVWDRGFFHMNDLHQCIADFPLCRVPRLNVIDAYRVMLSGGPRGSSYRADIALKKMQIISTDIVAADAAAALTWGAEPSSVAYIKKAQELGLGTADLSKLNIERIRV